MKYAILLSTALLCWAQPPAPQVGHVPVGGYFPQLDNLPSPLKESTTTWIGQRFDFPIGTAQDINAACVAAGRICNWSQYLDHVVMGPSRFYTVKDWAASQSYTNWQDTWLHSKINYTVGGTAPAGHPGAVSLGQFDFFEQPGEGSGSYTAASKGLWVITSGTYVDKTVVAYDGSNPFQVTDTVEFGYMFPFDQINLTFTVASTRALAWQYWNGSAWTTLTIGTDNTIAMSTNGQVKFSPPSNWATKIENSSASKYWVRAVVSGAGTSPTIKRAWTDEWVQTPQVWGLAGGTYSDTTSNIHYGWADTVVTDKLELGFVTQPSGLYVVKATGGTGTPNYQYWNGSAWTEFTYDGDLQRDHTSGLNTGGFVDWVSPSDWAQVNENGVTAYWVRIVVPSNRTISTVWSVQSLRGWSYTNGSRINTGTDVEYNPTPPAGSLANFKYQATVLFRIWNSNYSTFNPSAKALPGGTVSLQGAFNAYLAWQQHLTYGNLAVFWDDLLGGPATDPASSFPGSGTTDWTGSNYSTDLLANQVVTGTTLRGLSPLFYTESNVYPFSSATAQALNMAWSETFSFTPANGTRYINSGGDSDQAWMDYYLPATNLNSTLGLMIWRDYALGGVLQSDAGPHFWDLGERGPQYALASYLLGANANTGFEYNSVGSFYYDVGQWWTKSNVYKTTLTNTVTQDLTVGAKNITVGSTCALGTCATSVSAVSTFAINVDAQHLWNLGTLQSSCWTGSTNVAVSSQSIASRNAGGTIHIVNVNFASTANVTCVVLAGSDHGTELCNSGNGSLPTIMIGRQAVCTFGVNNGTEVIVPDPIYETVLSGTTVYAIIEFYQSVDTLPVGDTVYRYGMSFPAMFLNYGTPTGVRNDTWRLGSAVKGPGITCTTNCTNVARRDYTTVTVITRPFMQGTPILNDSAEIDVASVPFCINLAQVYPACTGSWKVAMADGTRGPLINSLSLKAAEGVVLWNISPTNITTSVKGKTNVRGSTHIKTP